MSRCECGTSLEPVGLHVSDLLFLSVFILMCVDTPSCFSYSNMAAVRHLLLQASCVTHLLGGKLCSDAAGFCMMMIWRRLSSHVCSSTDLFSLLTVLKLYRTRWIMRDQHNVNMWEDRQSVRQDGAPPPPEGCCMAALQHIYQVVEDRHLSVSL